MDLKITDKKENALLSRTDVQATITFEGATPTRKEVVKELAKQLKTKEELIIVREIKTAFGNTTAKVDASVYSNKEVMTKVEVKRMIEKHNFKEEAKAEPEEEAKAAPKEEAKAEPAKEEAPKAEEKPAEEVKPEAAKEEAPKEEKKKEGE